MGYDTDRFEDSNINEELICSICAGVLENPLTTHCDHLFCSDCINDWLRNHHTCPIDRCPLRSCMLKRAPRAIRNLINRLKIYCPYRDAGCRQLICLEQYESHQNECDYNPDSFTRCSMYCQRMMTRRDLATHNCIEEMAGELMFLRNEIHQRDEKIRMLNKILILFALLFMFMYLFLPFSVLIYQMDIFIQLFWQLIFSWPKIF